MPEAAVDEDHPLARGEDEIGFAGQIGAVKSEPIAELVRKAADKALGLTAPVLERRKRRTAAFGLLPAVDRLGNVDAASA